MKTPKQHAQMYQGAKHLAPGLYVQPDGTALIHVAELLEHYGLRNTPENVQMVQDAMLEICQQQEIVGIVATEGADGMCHETIVVPRGKDEAGKGGAA